MKKALENPHLGPALRTFSESYRDARSRAFQNRDFQELVRRVIRIKEDALLRLPELYRSFKDRAERSGARVHWASTAEEARRIVGERACAEGARTVVKSKSMTAEEIFLNDHLEALGMNVLETDLGERIVQLRGEGPSHMVMPAIHLTRKQVAELFSGTTGSRMDPDDIQALVNTARKELRRAFLEAEVGITGANFAVADTGTLGLVTNEGNGRLVTTLPPRHIALVGIEKLLPDISSALEILNVLPKNATGQAISSYVTWITGAVPASASPSGRKELDIVFLDNGRTSLAADPRFREALRCIRCGGCANVCPAYTAVGGHNYGYVYVGAIGLILTFFYHGRENARFPAWNCLNCQACKAVCPAGIDLPRLIREVRTRVSAMDAHPPLKHALLSWAMKDRNRFHALLRQAARIQKPWVNRRQGTLRHLPFVLSGYQETRTIPALSRRPLRERWEDLGTGSSKSSRLRAALFSGCLADFVFPEQGEALLEILRHRNISLVFPRQQTCCGLPALMLSQMDTARQTARQNLAAFEEPDFDVILTLCASCASHMKDAYLRLFPEEPDTAVRASRFTAKLVDFSTFLTDTLAMEPVLPPSAVPVAYHAPCHLCRGLRITRAPRELIRLAGYTYIPSRDEEVCCGLGGSYALEFPDVSARVLRRKIESLRETGASMVVTDCPGCVLQLRGGALKTGESFEVKHMVEAVALALRHAGTRAIINGNA